MNLHEVERFKFLVKFVRVILYCFQRLIAGSLSGKYSATACL